MIKNRRNFYRILQVQPDAPLEIIRASYRTLMRELKNHPDLGGSTSAASVLNEAYETLSDPKRRTAYDKKIQINRFKRTTATSKPPTAASKPTAAASKPTPSTSKSTFCTFCKTSLAPVVQTGKNCPTCNVPLPLPQERDLSLEKSRQIARMKKNDLIFYSCTWPETLKEGKMIDLSPKGMRFSCPEKIDPGTVLKITTPVLKACGVVTNQRQERENHRISFETGISFVAVTFEETRGSFISVSG